MERKVSQQANSQMIVDEMSSKIHSLILENILLTVKVKELNMKIEEMQKEKTTTYQEDTQLL